jgi:hypothetical protein
MIDYDNLKALKEELQSNGFWDMEMYNGNPWQGKPLYSSEEQVLMKNKCEELKLKIFLLENGITTSYDEKNSIRCANDY